MTNCDKTVVVMTATVAYILLLLCCNEPRVDLPRVVGLTTPAAPGKRPDSQHQGDMT